MIGPAKYDPNLGLACSSGRNRTGHGTTDWFQIGKGVRRGWCHPAYLTYMQSTS